MAGEIAGLAAKIAAGERVTEDEASGLMEAQDLLPLGMLASDVRLRRHGARATFVRVHDVSLDEAADAELPLEAAGELRLVGQPATAEQAVAAVGALAARAPGVAVTGFRLADLRTAAGAADDALAALLAELKAAGLAAVASSSVDDPAALARTLAPLSRAGVPLARLTVERPIAIPDAPGWLAALRRLPQEGSVVRAFSPLAHQPPGDQPTTGYDDVRLVALARLLLDDVEHIQVDWTRAGAKLAQAALLFGADDVDNVPARDLEDLGPRRTSLEEVRRNIRAASLEPVERDGRFARIAR